METIGNFNINIIGAAVRDLKGLLPWWNDRGLQKPATVSGP